MRKKISISDVVLFSLEQAVDGYMRFENFTYHHYRYHWGIPELKKSSLAQALRRLRIDGYIDLDQYNDRLVLKLTKKGKEESLLRRILKDEKWDGNWRIVIWDIPEKHRKVRDILRGKLKSWGFVPWQKSVWVSQKQITEVLKDFIKDIGVEKWVIVIESNNVSPLQFISDRK